MESHVFTFQYFRSMTAPPPPKKKKYKLPETNSPILSLKNPWLEEVPFWCSKADKCDLFNFGSFCHPKNQQQNFPFGKKYVCQYFSTKQKDKKL